MAISKTGLVYRGSCSPIRAGKAIRLEIDRGPRLRFEYQDGEAAVGLELIPLAWDFLGRSDAVLDCPELSRTTDEEGRVELPFSFEVGLWLEVIGGPAEGLRLRLFPWWAEAWDEPIVLPRMNVWSVKAAAGILPGAQQASASDGRWPRGTKELTAVINWGYGKRPHLRVTKDVIEGASPRFPNLASRVDAASRSIEFFGKQDASAAPSGRSPSGLACTLRYKWWTEIHDKGRELLWAIPPTSRTDGRTFAPDGFGDGHLYFSLSGPDGNTEPHLVPGAWSLAMYQRARRMIGRPAETQELSRVRGRVVDEAGRPIRGVPVVLYWKTAPWPHGRKKPRGLAYTDREGRFDSRSSVVPSSLVISRGKTRLTSGLRFLGSKKFPDYVLPGWPQPEVATEQDRERAGNQATKPDEPGEDR